MERYAVAIAVWMVAASAIGGTAFLGRGNFENALDSAVAASFSSTRIAREIAERIGAPKRGTLLFTGDIMLDRGVAWKVRTQGEGNPHFPFQKVAEILERADLTIGNLEGPVTTRGTRQGSIYSFQMDPAVVRGLAFSGFDIVSLANNHIWDYGREGLEDTVTLLIDSAIQPIGAGLNRNAANAPVVMNVGDTRVAFLSFTTVYPKGLEARDGTPGISTTDRGEMQELVHGASADADITVALMHWGVEYEISARDAERELGRALIDAGADLVVGHHPHVVQEVERYGEGWIAYSLGNFVFDQDFSKETKEGLVLEVALERGAITAVTGKAVKANADFQPEFILRND